MSVLKGILEQRVLSEKRERIDSDCLDVLREEITAQ